MKYLIRAFKYYIYLLVILVLVLLILVKLNLANADISTMFRNGYDSIWQIALLIAAFSALYPKLAFSSMNVAAPGSFGQQRDLIMEIMDSRGYKLLSEEGEKAVFILRSPLSRMFRMWEDKVVVSKTFDGIRLEGFTKDIVRIASALEFKINLPEK